MPHEIVELCGESAILYSVPYKLRHFVAAEGPEPLPCALARGVLASRTQLLELLRTPIPVGSPPFRDRVSRTPESRAARAFRFSVSFVHSTRDAARASWLGGRACKGIANAPFWGKGLLIN